MKDATVSARVEDNIKAEAEEILQQLGVPVSVVINSLYRQIILHRGIPFSMALPTAPATLDSMTSEELNNKLEQSYQQSHKQQAMPYAAIFDGLEKGLT